MNQVATAACLCCGASLNADSAEAVHLADRRKGLSGQWHVIACSECTAWSMVPVPTPSELAGYYESYTEEESPVVHARVGARFPSLRRIFHLLSGDVDPRDFVSVPAGGRVLDYGSGQGTYMIDFHQRGFDISGAEVTDSLVLAGQRAGLAVRKVADFDSIPFADGEFDVVYLMQVFEHLRGPRRFMHELSRVLKPGGHLYLAVPNIDSTWRKVFGLNWISGWFAPFHVAHYNLRSLTKLGAQSGFVVKRSWSSTPDSWFRLNIRACLSPHSWRLDSAGNWLNVPPMRVVLMLLLRLCELFIRERDCLVVQLERR
jgi:SAM-dependent methyltransferase